MDSIIPLIEAINNFNQKEYIKNVAYLSEAISIFMDKLNLYKLNPYKNKITKIDLLHFENALNEFYIDLKTWKLEKKEMEEFYTLRQLFNTFDLYIKIKIKRKIFDSSDEE